MKNRAKLLSAFVASIVLAFALTACGNSASSNQSASNQPASASASANEVTQVGDIVLPTQEEALAKMGLEEAPKSVLCATYNTTIMAHALGLDITGTVTTTRPIPDDLKDTPTIGVVTGRSDFDFEKILAFGGDAVLADSQYEAYA